MSSRLAGAFVVLTVLLGAPGAVACVTDADCGPSLIPCYRQRCVIGRCRYEAIPGCCTDASQCDDTNPCTADACVAAKCTHTPVGGCCVVAADCPAGAPCTEAVCTANACNYEPVAGCCTTEAACDDGNICTADRCDASRCVHDSIAGCCRTVAECSSSGDPCLTVSCAANRCTQTPVTEAECADTNPCTLDACVPASGCAHELVGWQTLRGSLAASVTDPACTDRQLPKTLRKLLQRAATLTQRAGSTAKASKQQKLLGRADGSLRKAAGACDRFRSRKKGGISLACHDVLSARIVRQRQWITCLRGSPGEALPTCGNGRIDKGEPCDGAAGSCPAGQRCSTACQCEPEPQGPPPLQGLAVGAWSGGAECNGGAIAFGWFLCPQGRLRGFETIQGHDFLDCGTWRVEGSQIVLDYRYTSVEDPGVNGQQTLTFEYRTGELVWVSGCPFPLRRAAGAVDATLCTSGTCSAGGTGEIGCGTDCDCGRCWYCESGTCRYGGEGPFGCTRGCPWSD